MKAIKNKNIAIVGGGPGGLTLARLLQMNGAKVNVYERDANREVRVQGATLDLHEESGLKALEAAGLMDAFNTNYRPGADKLRVVDKHGNIVLDEHGADGGSYNRPEIDRGPLRKILLDSLQPDTVIWNSQFVSLSKQENGVIKLEFKKGTTAYADLVIAADGANSKIRPYITPIEPFYAGVSVIEGAVYNSEKASPRIHELLNGGKIFAMGDEKTLIVSSKGDGSLVFYAGIKSSESWLQDSGIDFKNKAQVFAWFKQEFAGWDTIWDELFENAEPVFIPRPQYCMPLDQTWKALPNLTMLGDAAHLMPPYAGEGVNMAMLDALELAQHLLSDEFENTGDAIAAYEKQMRTKASETAAMTLEQTDSLHSADGLKNLVAMFNPEE
ncbi:NAD(P)/FAD-dependent oxidoreductase [Mucilaginibacter sp. cycad4]|uniref:FAD-dependent oxidoreductase n=1 Tax=Mucilaginibacter sp. cycad4 TaxID=3342096 RepID=UPI002AAB51C5|nr:NAD(P)/FAD-dependent oxidoreductase [Mucilaginibacter gossypii]WPU99616.1 NAD(P)/FAD-dependent oxidoreductase [Mucilaginibacter gossypii]